jgi:hypothetical protein
MTGDLELRVTGRFAAYPPRIYKAGLLLKLTDIRQTVAIQNLAGAKSNTTLLNNTNFDESRVISIKDNFGSGTTQENIFCNAKATSSGAGAFVLKSHSTTTLNNSSGVAGTSGAGNISGSTLNFTDQSTYTTLEAGPLATTNLNTMFLNFTKSSGSFDLGGCFYQTEADFID